MVNSACVIGFNVLGITINKHLNFVNFKKKKKKKSVGFKIIGSPELCFTVFKTVHSGAEQESDCSHTSLIRGRVTWGNVVIFMWCIQSIKHIWNVSVQETKLIYASSSSVYDKHTPVPFRLTARTDQPGNMYTATKEIGERLANYYCLEYNMSTVGLRFFTVYGPWGRPDMATSKFAEAMVSGQEVPMFHVR